MNNLLLDELDDLVLTDCYVSLGFDLLSEVIGRDQDVFMPF